MEKKIIKKICVISAIVLLVLSIISISMGFDKMLKYRNSDSSPERNINAYVGGDAYNYIINANYFAGYVSLGGCLIVAGSIMGITAMKIDDAELKKQKHSM